MGLGSRVRVSELSGETTSGTYEYVTQCWTLDSLLQSRNPKNSRTESTGAGLRNTGAGASAATGGETCRDFVACRVCRVEGFRGSFSRVQKFRGSLLLSLPEQPDENEYLQGTHIQNSPRSKLSFEEACWVPHTGKSSVT